MSKDGSPCHVQIQLNIVAFVHRSCIASTQ
jgi:hypothetical protein